MGSEVPEVTGAGGEVWCAGPAPSLSPHYPEGHGMCPGPARFVLGLPAVGDGRGGLWSSVI